jgi:uncharacterized membrane protein
MLNSLKKRNNATFYATLVAQILIAIQMVALALGYDVMTEALQNRIILAADAILLVLGTLGVVNNPTSPGLTSKKGGE